MNRPASKDTCCKQPFFLLKVGHACGRVGKHLPTLPLRTWLPRAVRPLGSTCCWSCYSSSVEAPATAGAADNPGVFLFSPLLRGLSLFDLDLQMGECICYYFWNWALKQCRSLSFLTSDNSVCLGQVFCMFRCNLSLFHPSFHVLVYSHVSRVLQLLMCSCVF